MSRQGGSEKNFPCLVVVPVSKPFLLMSDASPVEGSTMWMRCSLENGTGPVHYSWKHETRNGNVSVFAEGNASVVNVTDVNRNHSGWYRCVASNAVNSQSSNRLWLDTICESRWRPRKHLCCHSLRNQRFNQLV